MRNSVAERLDKLALVPSHRPLLWLIGAGLFDRFDFYPAGSVPGELVHNGMSSVPANARFISPTSSACYWAPPAVT
jgi:MFS transporter, putative metabolite:H+ symporter